MGAVSNALKFLVPDDVNMFHHALTFTKYPILINNSEEVPSI